MTRPNSSTTQSMLNILIPHIFGRCHASPRARFYVYMLFGILACPQNIACARHQRWRICSLTYIFMEGFDLPDLLRKARIKNEHVAYMLYTFTYTRLRQPPGPPPGPTCQTSERSCADEIMYANAPLEGLLQSMRLCMTEYDCLSNIG